MLTGAPALFADSPVDLGTAVESMGPHTSWYVRKLASDSHFQ